MYQNVLTEHQVIKACLLPLLVLTQLYRYLLSVSSYPDQQTEGSTAPTCDLCHISQLVIYTEHHKKRKWK